MAKQKIISVETSHQTQGYGLIADDMHYAVSNIIRRFTHDRSALIGVDITIIDKYKISDPNYNLFYLDFVSLLQLLKFLSTANPLDINLIVNGVSQSETEKVLLLKKLIPVEGTYTTNNNYKVINKSNLKSIQERLALNTKLRQFMQYPEKLTLIQAKKIAETLEL